MNWVGCFRNSMGRPECLGNSLALYQPVGDTDEYKTQQPGRESGGMPRHRRRRSLQPTNFRTNHLWETSIMHSYFSRRSFLQTTGLGAAAASLVGKAGAQPPTKPLAIQGFEETPTDPDAAKDWKSESDRKIRGGHCRLRSLSLWCRVQFSGSSQCRSRGRQ